MTKGNQNKSDEDLLKRRRKTSMNRVEETLT
jgi:hypothetical protein